jgi:competence protein ComEC
MTSQHELPAGGRVTVLASVASRPQFLNPSPMMAWPDSRLPIRATVVTGGGVRIDALSWLASAIVRVRGAIRNLLAGSLSEPHAGIARALLLGEGMAVSSELNEAIRDAGVSHVLAVSGMHVTVLAGALVALVRHAWLRSPLALQFEAARAAAALGVLLAPLVARVCGASPSAWRAAFTSAITYGLIALGLRPSALAVSAFAVIVYAVYDPREALHPGFVLSVLATAALLTGARSGHGLIAAARESARAWLSTAPFLALCFGSTSLIALLANVVLLPLGGLLIPLVVLQLFAAALGAAEALGVRWLFETASGAFVAASRLCSSLDPGLQIPPLTALQGGCACVVAAVWLARPALRTRLVATGVALALSGGSEWRLRHPLAEGELRVTFLDVGQGDSALIETGTGEVALIDGGGSVNGGPDPGAEAVVPMLRALRITRLDLVVLSHPHPDHYGGLAAVLETVDVAELWDTGQAESEGDTGAASQLVSRARQLGTTVHRPSDLCGRARRLGRAVLQVLSPCPSFDEGLGANDNSFVLRLAHGARSVLLTGDVELAAEAGLVANTGRVLDSDVLKVPHHGSRTSSTPELLQAVSPWLSVISCGRANRFGHPHAEVVERLRATSKHVLRTDRVGGVRLVSDGRRLRVEAWDRSVALSL